MAIRHIGFAILDRDGRLVDRQIIIDQANADGIVEYYSRVIKHRSPYYARRILIDDGLDDEDIVVPYFDG